MKSVLRATTRLLFKPVLAPWVPIAVQRHCAKAAGLLSKPPRGTGKVRTTLGGVPALHYRTAAAATDRAVLFLHGGAYILGGEASHGGLAARLGHAAAAQSFLVDYRLAPEHPYPAALDDALAAYKALLQQYPAGRIAIAGDSAGGNLALVTAIAIRDAGLPPPAALALISPWTDMSGSGESVYSRAHRDPMLSPSWTGLGARHFAGGLALDDPRLSPLFAKLEKLPPLLIHVGSEEILLSDSERLAQRAREAGVEVGLRCFEGLWHDFQLNGGLLAEADESIAGLGAFLRQHMH
jgi:acetyl esterase/lipase